MSALSQQHDMSVPTGNEESRPWRQAALWLLFLGPFFFLTYGYANWLASQSETVGVIVFDWEKHIPFIAWTIIPYWVIDALYGISLFMCSRRIELHRHALRLLTAQVVAVSCFILFPLGFTFERPETTGISGWLFTSLTNFDQPFNQAPSLHITLLVILWVQVIRHIPEKFKWLYHILCISIGISVLTTYQHHFIDIPTGALLGLLCVWMWPLEGKSVFETAELSLEPGRWRVASLYFSAALLLTIVAFSLKGTALWLLWPAVSLLMVALNYIYFGSAGFQKSEEGKMSTAAKWLYSPYLVAAYVNSRLWTRNEHKSVQISDGIHLGRLPSKSDVNASGYNAVVDMTAEFDKTHHAIDWHAIPGLDLLVPAKEDLVKAAKLIDKLEKKGNVLVACALGYSRSALAIMAWLLHTGRSATVEDAINRVREQRPGIVISSNARTALASLVE